MSGAMQPGSLPEGTGATRARAGSPRPPVQPVEPGPEPVASRGAQVAAVLKLASALCGLAAVGLFVLPLLRGEVSASEPTREERSPFKGAILVLESQPPGATVRVDGLEQGETPVSVGLDCVPGTTIVVEFSLRGYEKVTHDAQCPRDALVKVTARLPRKRGARSE